MIKNNKFKHLAFIISFIHSCYAYGTAQGIISSETPSEEIQLPGSDELRGRLSSAVVYPDFFFRTSLIEAISNCRLEPEKVLEAVNQANQEYIDGTSPRPLSARFIKDCTEDVVRTILQGSPRAIEILEEKELIPVSPRPSPRPSPRGEEN